MTGPNPAPKKISLCMIVKNEERFLADCLNSVRGCVDEMIVVDTGSEDRTVEIARSFGAKVFHQPWENDFSLHRNLSIRHASGEWIFWIDADEVLEPGGGEILRKACDQSEVDGLMVTMVCYFEKRTRESWNNSLKLFRNGQGIHFEGSVHNQVVGCRKVGFCPVKIHHYGYDLDEAALRRRFERTSGLLLRAIEKDPGNFIHHHNLAVAYASVRRFRKAVEEGLTAISLYRKAGGMDPNILWTYFVVSSSCFNLGLLDEAEEKAQEALRLNPEHFDSLFVLASIAVARKEWDRFDPSYRRIRTLIERYRKDPEQLGRALVNKISELWRVELDHAAMLLARGMEKEAEGGFQKAASEAPSPAWAFRLAAVACREQRSFGLAGRLLDRAAALGLDPHATAFEKALIHKESGDQGEYERIVLGLIEQGSALAPELACGVGMEAMKMGRYREAESLLSSAAEQGHEYPGLLTSLALACKYQGKIDRALEWNQKALTLEEKDLDALVNLGNLFYELQQWDQAAAMYQRALDVDVHEKTALLRLSLLSLMGRSFQKCVRYCDQLMSDLQITREITVGTASDLAPVYRLIGEGLRLSGAERLYREAVGFASVLEENG